MRKILKIKARDFLKRYRLSHGVTREDIAEAVDCTTAYIGMVENQDSGCREKTAMNICKFLKKDFDELFIIE